MPIGFQGVDLPERGPIGWGCITGGKFEQRATLLRQGAAGTSVVINPDDIESGTGSFVSTFHEITGEPIRIWVPTQEPTGFPNDPTTPEDESLQTYVFPCQARSIITGGLNSQGTTQRFTTKGTYENVEYVEMQVPPHVIITKNDRITNITNSSGDVVWKEEDSGTFKPTVFNVLGVAPSLDPFGSLVEWFILLKRPEIQGQQEGA